MVNNRTLKAVYSALFTALIFVGTQFIRIPLPFGYFNMGDCFIILSAVIIGGKCSMIASALGAVLADVLSGYIVYAPATVIIKPLMAAVMIAVLKLSKNEGQRIGTVLMTVGAVACELVMVCGYFVYDTVIYNFGGAIASLSGNILQGFAAVVVSVALVASFEHSGLLKRIKLH